MAYFPNRFKGGGNIQLSGLRIKRVNELMDSIIDGADVEDEVFKLEKEILLQNKPNSWNVHDEVNLERIIEVDYTKYSISVSKPSGIDVDKVDVFTFYASVEQIENEFKPNKNV